MAKYKNSMISCNHRNKQINIQAVDEETISKIANLIAINVLDEVILYDNNAKTKPSFYNSIKYYGCDGRYDKLDNDTIAIEFRFVAQKKSDHRLIYSAFILYQDGHFSQVEDSEIDGTQGGGSTFGSFKYLSQISFFEGFLKIIEPFRITNN